MNNALRAALCTLGMASGHDVLAKDATVKAPFALLKVWLKKS